MSAALDSPWRRLRYTRLIDLLRGRLDGSLDWRRVIETGGLPAELTSIVSQLVRRSRLWPNERVAVATEFVSHFREGLEAGQSSAELAASFGDATAAAKLVQRAKKRGRSLWWHAWRWCFWGVTALAAAYVFLWARMWLGRPVVRVDYLAEVNRRAAAVDPDEAAWPRYERAMRELGYRGDKLPTGVDWNELPQHAATNASFAAFEARHRETIAALREATEQPGLGAVAPSRGDPQRDLLATRIWLPARWSNHAVQVLSSQARLAAAQGDLETAVADAIAVLNLSRQLQEQPFLTSSLYAIDCSNTAYEFIEELVREHRDALTDEQLRDLAHATASVQFDWGWWIESERMFSRDLMQHIFTDNGAGDGHMTAEGLELMRNLVEPLAEELGDVALTSAPSPRNPGWWQRVFNSKALVAPLAMASRREMTETFERDFNEVQDFVNQPLWEWTSPEVDDSLAYSSAREQLKYYPLTLFSPSASVWRRQVEENRGHQEGVLVGLALELYHREQGAWPEKLTELSPQYLPRLPVDRMNGKPFGYVVRENRPVVYSVGSDFDDDGGQAVAANHEWLVSPGGYWGSRSFTSDNDGDWVLWAGEAAEVDDSEVEN